MVLSTHAIIGASLARLIPPHPILAFFIGMLSHYIVDLIPHWQYTLRSIKEDRGHLRIILTPFTISRDAFFLAIDILVGIVFIYSFLESGSIPLLSWNVWFGAIGGMTPDLIAIIHMALPTRLTRFFQFFHKGKRHFSPESVIGFVFQALLVVIFILFSLRIISLG